MGAITESRSMPIEESMASFVDAVIDWGGSEHLKDDASIVALEVLGDDR